MLWRGQFSEQTYNCVTLLTAACHVSWSARKKERLARNEERWRMRRKEPFAPALNPIRSLHLWYGKVVLWIPPEQTQHNVSQQQWCAVHSSSRANAGRATGRLWARAAPLRHSCRYPLLLLLQLTAYPHSTAGAAPAAARLWLEEEGTTCSVVQPRRSEAGR